MGNVQDGGSSSASSVGVGSGVPIDSSDHLVSCLRSDAEAYHDSGQFRLAIANYKAICECTGATSQDFLRLGEVYMNEIATQSATGVASAGEDPTHDTRRAAKEALLEARRRCVTEEERSSINCLLDAIDVFDQNARKGNGEACGVAGSRQGTAGYFSPTLTTSSMSSSSSTGIVVPACLRQLRPLHFVRKELIGDSSDDDECQSDSNSRARSDAVEEEKKEEEEEVYYVYEFRGDEAFAQFLPSIATRRRFSHSSFVSLAVKLDQDGLWLHETPVPAFGKRRGSVPKANSKLHGLLSGLNHKKGPAADGDDQPPSLSLEKVEELANRLLTEVTIPRVLEFFEVSQDQLDEVLGRKNDAIVAANPAKGTSTTTAAAAAAAAATTTTLSPLKNPFYESVVVSGGSPIDMADVAAAQTAKDALAIATAEAKQAQIAAREAEKLELQVRAAAAAAAAAVQKRGEGSGEATVAEGRQSHGPAGKGDTQPLPIDDSQNQQRQRQQQQQQSRSKRKRIGASSSEGCPKTIARRLVEGFLLKRPSQVESGLAAAGGGSLRNRPLAAFETPGKPQSRRASSIGGPDGRWQKRWFFFDAEAGAFCYSKTKGGPVLRSVAFADLSNVVAAEGEETSAKQFSMRIGGQLYDFCAASRKMAELWLQTLQRAAAGTLQDIHNRRRSSSSSRRRSSSSSRRRSSLACAANASEKPRRSSSSVCSSATLDARENYATDIPPSNDSAGIFTVQAPHNAARLEACEGGDTPKRIRLSAPPAKANDENVDCSSNVSNNAIGLIDE